jgi:putative peptidoglycan lipid II flippase
MSRSLTKSAGFISAATMASRLLGLVRDTVFANYFGTDTAADAYQVATRIPTLLRDLFAEGAMSAAFVPTFSRYLTRDGKPAAFRLGSQVINALFLITLVLVALGIVFAEPLTRLYTDAAFEQIPGQLSLTVWLTRVNMPFLMLVALAAATMGMLNGLRRFFMPALAPAMYNVVFIVCTIAGVPLFMRLGVHPIMACSAGMLAGGLAQIVTQLPRLRAEGYRHEWTLGLGNPALREVLILMGPGSIGVAAAQINIFVSTSLATEIVGGPAALSYAFRLMYMPVGIIGVAVATAAIPDLARHAELQSAADMRRTLSWGMRLMLALSVPATLGLMSLAHPITRVIFERGAFNPDSTSMVAGALFFYAPGIIGYSLVKILSPTFYALKDARTPVVVSVVSVLANAVLNLVLYRVMGVPGLALGTALAATLNAAILFVLLSRRLDGLDGAGVASAFARVLLASLLMGLAAYGTEAGLARVWPAAGELPRIARLTAAIGVGVSVLVVASHLLHIEEFRQATDRVLARFRGARKP